MSYTTGRWQPWSSWGANRNYRLKNGDIGLSENGNALPSNDLLLGNYEKLMSSHSILGCQNHHQTQLLPGESLICRSYLHCISIISPLCLHLSTLYLHHIHIFFKLYKSTFLRVVSTGRFQSQQVLFFLGQDEAAEREHQEVSDVVWLGAGDFWYFEGPWVVS